MSLILDALRKSEAERRRGQAPDLFSGAASLPMRPRAQWRGLVAVAGIAVAVILLALWTWRNSRTQSRPAAATAPAIAAVAVTEPPATAPPPVPAAPTAAAPAPAAPIASAPAKAVVPLAAPSIPAPLPAAPLPAPPVPPPTAPAGETPAQDDAAPIAVLSAAERSTLPPLKLSMHVWNSDPGRRFAIVDGQRIAEGALVGGAVVEEIRRDGVVLNINGRRLLLSRP